MQLRIFQVDAFADAPFQGNPAAVVPLDSWLEAGVMQAIAAENNLAETAFFVREGDGFGLRWFTPEVEVPLCGHATLASAHVLFTQLGHGAPRIVFQTLSGPLTVTRAADGALEMDFPIRRGPQVPVPPELAAALGAAPVALIQTPTLVAVYDDPETVAGLKPDFAALARYCAPLDNIGVAATARAQGSDGWDFVSRFFAPAKGIDEDPVTGSAHCALAAYWGERLGKTRLVGRQISRRGGTVVCEIRGDRIGLTGRCVDYLQGEITV